MNITTKFNIGDAVYYLDNNKLKIRKGEIIGININIYPSKRMCSYVVKESNTHTFGKSIPADLVFKTKDEIAKFALKLTDSLLDKDL